MSKIGDSTTVRPIGFGRRGERVAKHTVECESEGARRTSVPFHRAQLPGRAHLRSWEDLNSQRREWCDKVNSTYKKHIRAVPRELFAVERLQLQPLPAWIPEVYRLHQRMVDMEGQVALHTNRYSVPLAWIGRRVELRETRNKIEIQLDARNLVTRQRIADVEHQRILLAQHRPPRGQGMARTHPHPEENAILAAVPEIAEYVTAVKRRSRKVPSLALRQLLRLVREYPRQPLVCAVLEAARYGLYDLDRLEHMILRRVAREYFLLDDGRERFARQGRSWTNSFAEIEQFALGKLPPADRGAIENITSRRCCGPALKENQAIWRRRQVAFDDAVRELRCPIVTSAGDMLL